MRKKLTKINSRQYNEVGGIGHPLKWLKEPERTELTISNIALCFGYDKISDPQSFFEMVEKGESSFSYARDEIGVKNADEEHEFIGTACIPQEENLQSFRRIDGTGKTSDRIFLIKKDGSLSPVSNDPDSVLDKINISIFAETDWSSILYCPKSDNSVPFSLSFYIPEKVFSDMWNFLTKYPRGIVKALIYIDVFRSEVDRTLNNPLWERTYYIEEDRCAVCGISHISFELPCDQTKEVTSEDIKVRQENVEREIAGMKSAIAELQSSSSHILEVISKACIASEVESKVISKFLKFLYMAILFFAVVTILN